jgi:hypothetical protein
VFLKLDFSKAYDRVDLRFLFTAMGVMGFPTEFIALTKLLFNGAHARVHINGRSTDYFSVQQGVRQGCPLAPYLFLIVGEVLNQCLKDEMQRQRIQGLNLPGIAAQQTTLQYANDTSLFLRGEEQVVRNTIELLNTFSFGSRLLFNWNKSMAYHWDPGGRPRPSGLLKMTCPNFLVLLSGYRSQQKKWMNFCSHEPIASYNTGQLKD